MSLTRLAIAAVFVLILPPWSAADEVKDITSATVDAGQLHGFVDRGVVRFLGVPYAAPPVGQLRWVAPQPVIPWTGVRDATKPGLPAAQGPGELADGTANEDCLFLNITLPASKSVGKLRPVMVWLHGGGLSGGTANTYDARRLVMQGEVIVVTVEFRLNIFGFFGFPELPGSGTFGLQDQQASLRWIHRNISAFGGDPENVTLFGESGGAIAACSHLTSPSAEGLFHKIILQSGAATTSWPRNAADLGPHGSFWIPLKEIETAGATLAAELQCPEPVGSSAALNWLRQQPASTLSAHASKFGVAGYGGELLPEDPSAAMSARRFTAVPAMSGCTRHEGRALALGRLLVAGGVPMTPEQYDKLLLDAFGNRRSKVEEQYPRSNYPSVDLAWAAIYTDRMFAWPQLVATKVLAEKAPVFAFEFAEANSPGLMPYFPGFDPGASHSGELPFLFDIENRPIDITTGKQVPLSEKQRELGDVMVRYWTQFARTGDPNAPGNPSWPRFDAHATHPAVQLLSSESNGIRANEDFSSDHHCAFWEEFAH